MSAQSNFTTLELPAGKVSAINARGTNFHVVFASADVQIKWPGGEFGVYEQGAGIDLLPAGQAFERLEIRNPTLGNLLVTIYIGGPLYRDSRASIIEPKTRSIGWSGTQIDATDGEDFAGVPSGLMIRRKAFQVTNLDPSANLQIRDPDGNVILTVFPLTSITLPISEAVEVYNATGAPIACNVSEIWWTL